MALWRFHDSWRPSAIAENREVEADRIEFTPGHVVWRDMEHRVVLAMRNDRVDELRQVPDDERKA